MTPEETMLFDQLTEKEAENSRLRGEVEQLRSHLSNYEQSDTIPPSPSELDTGDYTEDKREAEADFMRTRQSTMDSELGQIHQWMRDFDEKIDRIIDYIATTDRCDDCPKRPAKTRLTLASSSGE